MDFPSEEQEMNDQRNIRTLQLSVMKWIQYGNSSGYDMKNCSL